MAEAFSNKLTRAAGIVTTATGGAIGITTNLVGTSATITRFNAQDAVISGVITASVFSGTGQVGVASEGVFIGAGASMLNFASSSGSAIAIDPAGTNGIATVSITAGVSIGLAIALGG